MQVWRKCTILIAQKRLKPSAAPWRMHLELKEALKIYSKNE